MGHDWNLRTCSNPFLVGLELEAQALIQNAQRSVTIACDGLRHDRLHFLRHHTDIGAITAVVAEAIVAKPVGKMTEQDDVVLKPDI